jgi:hypothetical protein
MLGLPAAGKKSRVSVIEVAVLLVVVGRMNNQSGPFGLVTAPKAVRRVLTTFTGVPLAVQLLLFA